MRAHGEGFIGLDGCHHSADAAQSRHAAGPPLRDASDVLLLDSFQQLRPGLPFGQDGTPGAKCQPNVSIAWTISIDRVAAVLLFGQAQRHAGSWRQTLAVEGMAQSIGAPARALGARRCCIEVSQSRPTRVPAYGRVCESTNGRFEAAKQEERWASGLTALEQLAWRVWGESRPPAASLSGSS